MDLKPDLVCAQLRSRGLRVCLSGGSRVGAVGGAGVGGVSLRGSALALLCVALFASMVSLAGGSLGASPVLAQSVSPGPWARIWAKKLASGNVEFGVAVYAGSDVSPAKVVMENRYFGYASSVVETWYNSEGLLLSSGTDSVVAGVRARKLASGNLEFGFRVYGGAEDSFWMPRARYFMYEDVTVGDTEYSSAFLLRPHTQECLKGALGASTPSTFATKFGLFRDCEALLAAKDELAGTTNVLSSWTGSTPISSWSGVAMRSNRVNILSFRSQSLNGTIPKHLGKLSALEQLDLGRNELTGVIPAELRNLSNLRLLDLQGNELTGVIPVGLGDLSSLTDLGLARNNLTGVIPVGLGNLSNLTNLHLDGNNLTGVIPVGLGDLSSLTDLGLARNNLTGVIPAELGNLRSLTALHLNHNNLTGEIPLDLGILSNLRLLYLDHNELTGRIPASLGSLTSLEVLFLWGNLLSGPIPSQLGNLASSSSIGPDGQGGIRQGSIYFHGTSASEPASDDNPGLSGCIPPALNIAFLKVIASLPFCSP